jgi:tetratricopeptide (TPR) repeat protein
VTVIETHPEELLDRELRGSMTERERHLLMAHLQRCSACRMERQLRVDFERELAVSAQSLDLQMFVSDAIDAMEQLPSTESLQSLVAARARRPRAALAAPAPRHTARIAARGGWSALRPVAVLMLVCVALSAGVGIGAAQLGLAERALQLLRAGMDAAFGPAPKRQQAGAARARLAQRANTDEAPGAAQAVPDPQHGGAKVEPGARDQAPAHAQARSVSPSVVPVPLVGPMPVVGPIEAEEQAPQPAELEPPAPEVAAQSGAASAALSPGTPPAARQLASRGLGPSDASPRAPAAAARSDSPSPPAEDRAAAAVVPARTSPSTTLPIASAARLFEQANTVRHRGHAIEASALYRELQAQFPHSAEARLSVALVARMQLDQGESAAALAGFDAYLASSDTALREEAMVGRVRSLQRLGHDEEARSAAQTLLELYPDSAFAPAARKLLEPPVP